MVNNNTNEFPDYVTFPRTFENYRWYKPLLTIIITVILFLIIQIILGIVFGEIYGKDVIRTILYGGYETLNTTDASILYTNLSIGLLIPSMYIASKIVRDRPFSSYSSSRGGWNWKLYFKCLTIPFVVYVVYSIIILIMSMESGGTVQISPIFLVLCLVLVPFQCIAEEYIFRGLFMQTFGSWFKIPVLAIILQTILFGLGHSYNSIGIIAVVVNGIIFGLLAWQTNGLEAGAAIHSINNLLSFYIVALGLGSNSSTLNMFDFVSNIAISVVCVLLIYIIGNKKGWFNEKTSESSLF